MAMPMTDIEFDTFSNAQSAKWLEQQHWYYLERNAYVQALVDHRGREYLDQLTIERVAASLFKSERILTRDEVEMTVRIDWQDMNFLDL